ncbi:MAG: ferredoxin [Candidatus Altiarchaeota archaeon]|nr:ferredoxin [Candidatus Altiarchaeota archaeon]
MKVSVNKDCIGCGACVAIAPGIFEMNQETMKSVVIKQPKTAEDKDLTKQAVEACPVDAIKIKE